MEVEKRDDCGSDGESAEKRQRVAVTEEMEGLGDDILAWLSVDEEAVGELMKLLDGDKSEPITSKVRFIDDPYSSPLIIQSSASYVTINGNEESCGSSFSDSDSSVMASVDMRGVHIARKFEDGGECGSNYDEARIWLEGEEISGLQRGMTSIGRCDGLGWDDEALARFIGDNLF